MADPYRFIPKNVSDADKKAMQEVIDNDKAYFDRNPSPPAKVQNLFTKNGNPPPLTRTPSTTVTTSNSGAVSLQLPTSYYVFYSIAEAEKDAIKCARTLRDEGIMDAIIDGTGGGMTNTDDTKGDVIAVYCLERGSTAILVMGHRNVYWSYKIFRKISHLVGSKMAIEPFYGYIMNTNKSAIEISQEHFDAYCFKKKKEFELMNKPKSVFDAGGASGVTLARPQSIPHSRLQSIPHSKWNEHEMMEEMKESSPPSPSLCKNPVHPTDYLFGENSSTECIMDGKDEEEEVYEYSSGDASPSTSPFGYNPTLYDLT